MPTKVRFAMQKLTSFPMEKSCYDLKLEVLEQLRANNAFELVKVNGEFRSILRQTPWLVFGHHVYLITGGPKIAICKFYDYVVKLQSDFYVPFTKRIQSCDELQWCYQENATILHQLNSVKRLRLSVTRKKYLLKFLENFRLMINEKVYLRLMIKLFVEDQVISGLFKNFILNQLNDCEHVVYYCYSVAEFYFYYDVFAKTSIKMISATDGSYPKELVPLIVQSIVEKGIPSKNLRAHASVGGIYNFYEQMINFLSQHSDLKQFDEQSNQELVKRVRERLQDLGMTSSKMSDGQFFRRHIDASNDCVYVLLKCSFWAFYVEPQSEMIKF